MNFDLISFEFFTTETQRARRIFYRRGAKTLRRRGFVIRSFVIRSLFANYFFNFSQASSSYYLKSYIFVSLIKSNPTL